MSVNSGTSPTSQVTGENIEEAGYHDVSAFTMTSVNPPAINSGNAYSLAMTKWIQPWPTWNFEKVAYPLYDGICEYLGVPSNRPDFIKDYHFIGIMRNIDLYLNPVYWAEIDEETDGPATPAS